MRSQRAGRPISCAAHFRQTRRMLLVASVKRVCWLLLLLPAAVLCVGGSRAVARGSTSEFITTRRQQVDWSANGMADDVAASGGESAGKQPNEFSRQRYAADAVAGQQHAIEGRYMLRYRPQALTPRLYWHKHSNQQQQQQQEEAPPEPVDEPAEEPIDDPLDESGEGPVEEPPEVVDEPEPVPPEPMEPPAPPPPDETEVIETPSTTAPPARPPFRPTAATTMTTIMRPPLNYKPHFTSRLKNWLFGSPVELNLLQKHSAALAPNRASNKTRSKGFLSLFEVIKFANAKCSVAIGDIRTMEGICYHDFECKTLGGIATERCADGVGVCCVFLTGCGETSNQPVIYFESPNYPNALRDALICVLTVNLRENVQQVRLDFLMFELNRPVAGDCLDDQFIVSGQNVNFAVPVLCGINTGQHVYVHVGNSQERKIFLSFFARLANYGRSFNIKITQLESDLAPDGCLQYYTEKEGVVKSFNYDTAGSIVENTEATYLNNLNYVICLERAADTCSVSYNTEQVDSELLDFQIVNKDPEGNDLVYDGQAGAGIFNCPDDFVGLNVVRLCGERFNDGSVIEDYTVNAPVRDYAPGPIVLPFRSNEADVGRGFRLIYKQEACGTVL